jgi:Transposase DDE domain
VTNWAAYDAGLRARGSLTVWFTAKAIEAWRAEPRTARGGQPRYSSLAITTALTLRAVFRLALRQTEGLIGSTLQLLSFGLAVPDHSTLSRRAETLAVLRPRSGREPPGFGTAWSPAPRSNGLRLLLKPAPRSESDPPWRLPASGQMLRWTSIRPCGRALAIRAHEFLSQPSSRRRGRQPGAFP